MRALQCPNPSRQGLGNHRRHKGSNLASAEVSLVEVHRRQLSTNLLLCFGALLLASLFVGKSLWCFHTRSDQVQYEVGRGTNMIGGLRPRRGRLKVCGLVGDNHDLSKQGRDSQHGGGIGSFQANPISLGFGWRRRFMAAVMGVVEAKGGTCLGRPGLMVMVRAPKVVWFRPWVSLLGCLFPGVRGLKYWYGFHTWDPGAWKA